MFSFCDVILHNNTEVRGAFLYSSTARSIYIYSRNPVDIEGFKIDGNVTYIPGGMIKHVRFFSTVYLLERLSSLPTLTDNQKEMFVKELHRFLKDRELFGVEKLLERITIQEMMILLTEVENDKYIGTDGKVIRFMNDEPYPIDFNDPACLTWLMSSYMEASENMKLAAVEVEEELKEYRRVFYELSYDEIQATYYID